MTPSAKCTDSEEFGQSRETNFSRNILSDLPSTRRILVGKKMSAGEPPRRLKLVVTSSELVAICFRCIEFSSDEIW